MEGYTSNYYVLFDFFKVNNDFDILENEKYELYSIDGKKTGAITELGQYKSNVINEDSYDYLKYPNLVNDVLPSYVIDELTNINRVEDLNKFQTFGSNFNYSNDTLSKNIKIKFQIPVMLKNINAEPGYQKKDICTLANITIDYFYNDSNIITNKDIFFDILNIDEVILNYDELHNASSITDLNNFNKIYIESSCLNTDMGKIITGNIGLCTATGNYGSGNYNLVPYFKDQVGTVEFSIRNTVNNEERYVADTNKNLLYKIHVKNIGNAASSNNTITTNVPKEVIVDESGISDSGVYNSTNHTITWVRNTIEPDEEITLYYRATAPNQIEGKELVGNSGVKSKEEPNEVISNNTVVTLEKIIEGVDSNGTITVPNTNITIPVNLILVILLLTIITYVLISSKINKKEKD